MVAVACPETSIILRRINSQKSEHLNYTPVEAKNLAAYDFNESEEFVDRLRE
jgi:hypothetical protein